jgi:hypothetical protein
MKHALKLAALFAGVALVAGGTATAATLVTSGMIKDRTIRARDIHSGAVQPRVVAHSARRVVYRFTGTIVLGAHTGDKVAVVGGCKSTEAVVSWGAVAVLPTQPNGHKEFDEAMEKTMAIQGSVPAFDENAIDHGGPTRDGIMWVERVTDVPSPTLLRGWAGCIEQGTLVPA